MRYTSVRGIALAVALLASAAVLAGCAAKRPGAAQHSGVEEFEVEGWSYAAIYRHDDGALKACLVASKYENGINLMFVRHHEGYSIIFQKREWSLNRDDIYSVTLRIDDLWQKRFESRVLSGDDIEILLGVDPAALESIRWGSSLTLFAQAQTFMFELKREGTTLDRLERCYREHLPQTAAGYVNPFAAEQNPFKAKARAATGLQPSNLEEILNGATGLDFRAEPASEFTPEVELVYFLDDSLYGTFRQVPSPGNSVDGVLAATLAGMQANCSGRGVSGQDPGRDGGSLRVREGFVACEADDYFAGVLVIATDPKISVFVTTASMDDALLAEKTGKAIGRFFVP